MITQNSGNTKILDTFYAVKINARMNYIYICYQYIVQLVTWMPSWAGFMIK
jgi:hypothetical protein